ncbi:hypothetical protein Csp2054_06770 [Curtobacterium sp. 'Ferrero']|nr:hypothetical protein Csp2054_06770 [Curtobacterium sp. 'Ferrero']
MPRASAPTRNPELPTSPCAAVRSATTSQTAGSGHTAPEPPTTAASTPATSSTTHPAFVAVQPGPAVCGPQAVRPERTPVCAADAISRRPATARSRAAPGYRRRCCRSRVITLRC